MKIKVLLLVAILALPMHCMAQRVNFSYKGVSFKGKIKDACLTITEFDTGAESVVIPGIVVLHGKQWRVKEVSTFINGNNYLATSLELEEGIERIDKYSFNEFRKLLSVKLPSTIKYIGTNAFRKNSNITFHLPEHMKESYVWNGIPTSIQKDSNTWVAQNQSAPVVATAPVKQENQYRSPFPKKERFSVDDDIPRTSMDRQHTYCVIIANETYKEAPKVECAKNDGVIFAEYCRLTLGVPEEQIRVYLDAGYTDILRAIRFLESIQQFDKEASLIFYYSGHGIPNEQDKTAYLLPTDGSPKELQTCISLKSLYDRLGKIQNNQTCVLLDACFSGTNRENGEAILAARSIVRVKEEEASGNMIVLTAASADETAFALKDAQHGLFTYHLLKQLKTKKGKVKLGELYRSIKAEVAKSSVLENDKLQTPSIVYSPAMANTWEEIYF